MSNCNRFLFENGVVSSSIHTPSVTTLLENHPGAYTTTRTHNNGSELLFWERHLRRLCNSARILLNCKPQLLFRTQNYSNVLQKCEKWDPVICSLVNDSMNKVMPIVLEKRKSGEELAITALVTGNDNLESKEIEELNDFEIFDVRIHVSEYVPPVFGVRGKGANLAVVGRGRDVANAKYSDWVRLRKPLEKLRPPSATELLLSNDGDQILEGCLTNFFVVCLKDGDNKKASQTRKSFELQTAPLSAGVLPGVIREVIIDICSRNGIPLREVVPSWSQRENWVAAFISNSLRLVQHVEKILVPSSWDMLESKTLEDVSWEEKCFEDIPGSITSIIQDFQQGHEVNHSFLFPLSRRRSLRKPSTKLIQSIRLLTQVSRIICVLRMSRGYQLAKSRTLIHPEACNFPTDPTLYAVCSATKFYSLQYSLLRWFLLLSVSSFQIVVLPYAPFSSALQGETVLLT